MRSLAGLLAAALTLSGCVTASALPAGEAGSSVSGTGATEAPIHPVVRQVRLHREEDLKGWSPRQPGWTGSGIEDMVQYFWLLVPRIL